MPTEKWENKQLQNPEDSLLGSIGINSRHRRGPSELDSLYIRQGGCVMSLFVCRSVCLFVNNFAQKLPNGFAWNFQERWAMGQRTND